MIKNKKEKYKPRRSKQARKRRGKKSWKKWLKKNPEYRVEKVVRWYLNNPDEEEAVKVLHRFIVRFPEEFKKVISCQPYKKIWTAQKKILLERQI